MSDQMAININLNARKAPKRQARPATLNRRSTPGSPSDLTPKTSPSFRAVDKVGRVYEKLDMTTSFLQYCAMCEKQILTPSNSILYCSEACRRKDSCKPLALANSAMPTTTTPPASAPSSPRPILAPRTPTGVSASHTPSIRIPIDLHDAKADLDPSEWKPKSHRSSNSEAFRYLSQFHRSTAGRVRASDDYDKADRPFLGHRSTTSMSNISMSTPSLTSTPTTAASSMSEGGEYDFNTRRLPPRQNPMYYSASAGACKGIDLVMPHVAPVPTVMVGSALDNPDEGTWGKRVPVRVNAAAASSPDGIGSLLGSSLKR